MKSSDIEMKERKALAGSTTGFTYHSRAITGLDLERSGRHAQHATVTGAKASVQYPRQPTTSPWSGEIPESIEPPLGYAIDSQESVGEPAEIEESLSRLAASSVLSPENAEAARLGPLPSARPVPSGVSPSSSDGTFPLIRGRRL
jgi:hypothetical protein